MQLSTLKKKKIWFISVLQRERSRAGSVTESLAGPDLLRAPVQEQHRETLSTGPIAFPGRRSSGKLFAVLKGEKGKAKALCAPNPQG